MQSIYDSTNSSGELVFNYLEGNRDLDPSAVGGDESIVSAFSAVEMASLLTQCGFEVVSDFSADDLAEKYTLDRQDSIRALDNFRIVHAKKS